MGSTFNFVEWMGIGDNVGIPRRLFALVNAMS